MSENDNAWIDIEVVLHGYTHPSTNANQRFAALVQFHLVNKTLRAHPDGKLRRLRELNADPDQWRKMLGSPSWQKIDGDVGMIVLLGETYSVSRV